MMCRLLAYVSERPMSLREVLGNSFGSFSRLSIHEHADGWGVASFQGDQPVVVKEPVPAHSSPVFVDLTDNVRSDLSLIHFRWASPGLALTVGNTHPFVFHNLAFAHNGSAWPPSAIERFIAPEFQQSMEGTTDSERYLRAIVSAVDGDEIGRALAETALVLERNVEISGLNAIILTEDALYALCLWNPTNLDPDLPKEYYELHYEVRHDMIVVASSGWENEIWPKLENGQLMRVDRRTREILLTDIERSLPT